MPNSRAHARVVGKHPTSGNLVDELSSADLQAQLVKDALAGTATPLPWFVAACQRIAYLDKIPLDDAYQRVRIEVAHWGGHMPGAPGQ